MLPSWIDTDMCAYMYNYCRLRYVAFSITVYLMNYFGISVSYILKVLSTL